MSGQKSTPQPPPLHFMLDVIVMQVKSAKKTHDFLCEAFAEATPAAHWPNDKQQPPQGSHISQDSMHTIFRMGNTRIQFSTATSSKHSADDNKVSIAICIQDIDKAKRFLDKRGHPYKLGEWKTLPGSPRWIEFRDLDGYTWNVSDLVKG